MLLFKPILLACWPSEGNSWHCALWLADLVFIQDISEGWNHRWKWLRCLKLFKGAAVCHSPCQFGHACKPTKSSNKQNYYLLSSTNIVCGNASWFKSWHILINWEKITLKHKVGMFTCFLQLLHINRGKCFIIFKENLTKR